MLPEYLIDHYENYKIAIKSRLEDFKKIPADIYFYELCYCICTPQSSAQNASKVVEKLIQLNFREKQFNPVEILKHKDHYIRFHNTKSQRLLKVKDFFDDFIKVLNLEEDPKKIRYWMLENINGLGMKECSHFLRNIGYERFAILDRHILKHLVSCGVIDDIPKSISLKQYLKIEEKFLAFSVYCGIPLDELDLLFWSYQTGEILK